MKVSIPRAWTVGKSISFDPEAGARAEAAVAALAAQISAGLGGSILHRSLQQLQVGDDHPQYAGNAFPETITGQWNFQTIPFIQGDTLAEYIEDVVGGTFFDFLQDTTSVVWTYHETANELEANVPPEFVQDTVGDMLLDTTSIDLAYNDGTGKFTASIIDEYVQDLVGAMLADTSSVDLAYNDGAGTFTATVLPAGVDHNSLANLAVGDPHPQYALDSDLASYVPVTRTLTAGNGLTGGGDLSANRAFDVGAGTGITVNANDVAIANTAVTPGAYTYGSFTVDQQGRLTAASSGAAPAALANPSGLIGMSAVNGVATTALRSDGRHAIDPAIAPVWTADHTWNDNVEGRWGTGNDLRVYHDGTNSYLRTDTGELRFNIGATTTLVVGGTPGYFLVRRATQTTSEVGFGIQGGSSGADWYFYQPNGANDLFMYSGANRFVFETGGGFGILDGITAPATRTGFAMLYVDTADGDLKIKFGDGTIKTIVTD